MTDVHERVAKNIKRILAQKRLTAEHLALEIDRDKAHVSRILAGKKHASLDLLALMATALNVDVETFFKR
jgi:transcriptional regulator with XRE-family HTH domain